MIQLLRISTRPDVRLKNPEPRQDMLVGRLQDKKAQNA